MLLQHLLNKERNWFRMVTVTDREFEWLEVTLLGQDRVGSGVQVGEERWR